METELYIDSNFKVIENIFFEQGDESTEKLYDLLLQCKATNEDFSKIRSLANIEQIDIIKDNFAILLSFVSSMPNNFIKTLHGLASVWLMKKENMNQWENDRQNDQDQAMSNTLTPNQFIFDLFIDSDDEE